MSNKQIINANLKSKNMNIFFEEGLLEALNNDGIRVEGNTFIAETSEKIYKVPVSDFKLIFSSSFNGIFENDMPVFMKIDNLKKPGTMIFFYRWMNPVFETIGIKSMIEFGQKIKDKIHNDTEYSDAIRNVSKEELVNISLPDRKKYIDRFMKFGILKEEDKVELEYYADFPISKIEELVEKEVINKDNLIDIVAQIFYYEHFINEKKKKSKYNSRIIGAMNLLDNIEILNMYLHNGINDSEFYRTKIKKSDILSMPIEYLTDYLIRKDPTAPKEYKITSKDLINQYGKNLDKRAINELITLGYIEEEDLIYIYEINKALANTNYDKEKMYDNSEIEAFYTPKRLFVLSIKDKLNSYFIEKYIEMLDFKNDQEKFRQKSLILANGIKEIINNNKKNNDFNSENYIQRIIFYFFDIEFCDLQTAKENISEDFIEELFINDEIKIEEVLELYKIKLIGDDVISKYYSDEEIIELYEAGKINKNCLNLIKNNDLILEAFCAQKISFQDLIDLYLKFDKLSIEDLSCSLELSEVGSDNISNFIDENTSFEKIKELFKNMLIDYSTILLLKEQGIIDDKQFKEIKESISTKEFFEELKSGKKFKVMTLREGQTSQKKRHGDSQIKQKGDFSDELDLISKLLNYDVQEEVENEHVSNIESYNLDGKPTSLNGYRIFCNEELDGIVILQKSKKGNAIFVMNVLQLMYFLKGKENDNGEIEIQDRMRDKAYLKTIEGVEVVEHSKHFGRNLVEASSRVSQKISEQVSGNSDRKYKKDVEAMVDFMRELYIENSKERDNN